MFMSNVFAFQIEGTNKHDDAPDSLAQLVDMRDSVGMSVKLLKRPF